MPIPRRPHQAAPAHVVRRRITAAVLATSSPPGWPSRPSARAARRAPRAATSQSSARILEPERRRRRARRSATRSAAATTRLDASATRRLSAPAAQGSSSADSGSSQSSSQGGARHHGAIMREHARTVEVFGGRVAMRGAGREAPLALAVAEALLRRMHAAADALRPAIGALPSQRRSAPERPRVGARARAWPPPSPRRRDERRARRRHRGARLGPERSAPRTARCAPRRPIPGAVGAAVDRCRGGPAPRGRRARLGRSRQGPRRRSRRRAPRRPRQLGGGVPRRRARRRAAARPVRVASPWVGGDAPVATLPSRARSPPAARRAAAGT